MSNTQLDALKESKKECSSHFQCSVFVLELPCPFSGSKCCWQEKIDLLKKGIDQTLITVDNSNHG